MAAPRIVPAYNLTGGPFPPPQRHTLKASETFKKGDIVKMDTNEDILELSGADDTPAYGVAAENAENVVESGFVMVWPFTTNAVFAVSGDDDPTADDVNQSYGYVEDSDGVYTVDGTDTTNKFWYVVNVDTDRNLYFCTALDADRQVAA